RGRLQHATRSVRPRRRRRGPPAGAGERPRWARVVRGRGCGAPCRRRRARPHAGQAPACPRRGPGAGPMKGRVVLVGAGPGDPGLLTLRGQRWLAAADVVVHDYLVHPRLLESARPDAEIIPVGRSHGDGERLSQTDIDELLVARARAGRLVVRLKNGDPFVFGRGGADGEALPDAA